MVLGSSGGNMEQAVTLHDEFPRGVTFSDRNWRRTRPTWVCEDLLSLSDVDEPLLRFLLLLGILEVVRVPLLRQLPVGFDDLPLLRVPGTTARLLLAPCSRRREPGWRKPPFKFRPNLKKSRILNRLITHYSVISGPAAVHIRLYLLNLWCRKAIFHLGHNGNYMLRPILSRPPLHSQDLVVVFLPRLLEEPLCSVQPLLNLTVILVVFSRSFVVLDGWRSKRAGQETVMLSQAMLDISWYWPKKQISKSLI